MPSSIQHRSIGGSRAQPIGVDGIVAVRKPNGRVRTCVDYSTGLNDSLEASNYPLPTTGPKRCSPTCPQVACSVSSTCLTNNDSKKLLTISTNKELFQFLVPEVKSALRAFQRMVDSMIIADIPGIRSFIYETIVFGPAWDGETHAEADSETQQE